MIPVFVAHYERERVGHRAAAPGVPSGGCLPPPSSQQLVQTGSDAADVRVQALAPSGPTVLQAPYHSNCTPYLTLPQCIRCTTSGFVQPSREAGFRIVLACQGFLLSIGLVRRGLGLLANRPIRTS